MGIIHVFHIVMHISLLKKMWNLLKNPLYKHHKNIIESSVNLIKYGEFLILKNLLTGIFFP